MTNFCPDSDLSEMGYDNIDARQIPARTILDIPGIFGFTTSITLLASARRNSRFATVALHILPNRVTVASRL